MGFIYNGINSKNMKIKARLTSWQASPALRNAYEVVPGKAGVADFGCDISERIITISCSIYPQKSFADLVSVLDDLAAVSYTHLGQWKLSQKPFLGRWQLSKMVLLH